jgi:hypothetical protein
VSCAGLIVAGAAVTHPVLAVLLLSFSFGCVVFVDQIATALRARLTTAERATLAGGVR